MLSACSADGKSYGLCSSLQFYNVCGGFCVILFCVGMFRNTFPVHAQLLREFRDWKREGKGAAPPHSYHRKVAYFIGSSYPVDR